MAGISISALLLTLIASVASSATSLHEQIAAIAREAHGKVGVACALPDVALDCSLNAKRQMPMQSVYKLPIAIATLDAIERGRFTLTTEVKFLPSDLISPGQHSPLRDAHPGANITVPVRELLQLAVSESDGVASDILLRTVGGAKAVDSYIHRLGIAGIQIRDSERTLGRDVTAQYRNSAEPRAMVALLRRLADHSPLAPAHTALLFEWMTKTETGVHRLKGLLPPGVIVAHKTGTSGEDEGITHATNDAGLITLADGRRLAIAVFIEDSPESETVREIVIARIAQIIWRAANAAKTSQR